MGTSCPSRARQDIGTMFEDVFAELPWHLASSATQALAERRRSANDRHEHDPGAQRAPTA
jgi:hypothetical protein